MKVLVIAPHMDDEVLGVGGTIARHVARGDDVYTCFVAHRIYHHRFSEEENAREVRSAMRAKDVLGYKEAKFLNLSDERLDDCIQDILIPLESWIQEKEADIVYLPHRGDNHQDHRAVFQAAMVALRPSTSSTIRTVLCYEVPSSTEQSPPFPEYAFLPNCYIGIGPFLKTKIEALRCYNTELREFPHPRSATGIEILAKKRGMEIGFSAAEAFVIVRRKCE